MLFRIRASLILALFACVLTLVICMVNNARPYTILFRMIITFLIFGFCGFWIGGRTKPFYDKLKNEIKNKGQNIDIVADNYESEMVKTEAVQEFTPFIPDKLQHLTHPKQ